MSLERVKTRPIIAPGYSRVAVVPGGPPGGIPVPGILVSDALYGVVYFPGAPAALTDIIDLTGQFTVPAAGVISNTGGADTSAGKLLVLYQDRP